MPGISDLGGHIVFAYNSFLATCSQLKPRLQNTPSRSAKEHLSPMATKFLLLTLSRCFTTSGLDLDEGADKVSDQEHG